MPKDIDWEVMFKKYANIVGEAEGITFLHEDDWSFDEWKAIESLDI